MRVVSELLFLSLVLAAGCSSADIDFDAAVDSGSDTSIGVDSSTGDSAMDSSVGDATMMDTSVGDGDVVDAVIDSTVIDVPDGGFPTPGTGDIVISELMIDSDAIPDDFGEWFELHNPSTTTTYWLNGCSFFDNGGATETPTGVILLPGSYVSFAIGPSPGFTPDYVYTSGMKLSNDSPDSLTLRCGGTVVDVVAFDPTWPWAKGNSLSLDPDNLDAGDNDMMTSWCAGMDEYNRAGGDIDYGTPGMANPDCP